MKQMPNKPALLPITQSSRASALARVYRFLLSLPSSKECDTESVTNNLDQEKVASSVGNAPSKSEDAEKSLHPDDTSAAGTADVNVSRI